MDLKHLAALPVKNLPKGLSKGPLRMQDFAHFDEMLRPLLVRLPPRVPVTLYSYGRQLFLAVLVEERPKPYQPPARWERELWGLRFRSPVGNAAGMFKNGEGYELVAAQGAGFYLCGTTTATPRKGNRRHGVMGPFAPYPSSHAASNWLGLPNEGHAVVAQRLGNLRRVDGCPVGASLSADPGTELEQGLEGLIAGLEAYEAAGVDFLEINESCPNTEDESASEQLWERLEALAEAFLRRRQRPLPVVAKLSCDTDPRQVPALLDHLLACGFDGANFGNTSTDYSRARQQIAAPERHLFDYFVGHFGGGVSGRPLAPASAGLLAVAREHLEANPPDREFHLVRTGGVEGAADAAASLEAGAALCQWYTGYFEAFAEEGHQIYEHFYRELASAPSS
ncbi:MAG: hypothetical protein AAGD01_05565 [Acidobacteriota bacterium]